MRFYLGTHEPQWLGRTARPLFISRVRLARRRSFPEALGGWALDSGGYTALDKPPHRWTIGPEEYAEEVAGYEHAIGRLEWAAPQDHMCEPWIIEKTGRSVSAHIHDTVENFLDLEHLGPFIPVLQGFTMADYLYCLDLYDQAGVDLTRFQLVGLGTICRRQATDEIEAIISGLHAEGLKLHGFGVKKAGLARYGHMLTSADSMAWSFDARRTPVRLPGHTHLNCANCLEYAALWGDDVERRINHEKETV